MENSFSNAKEDSLKTVWASFGETPLEMEGDASHEELDTSANSNGCTQALHLEFDEKLDDSELIQDTQEDLDLTEPTFPTIGCSPTEEISIKAEKRLADLNTHDNELSPKKKYKPDGSEGVGDSVQKGDEEDVFSDVEIISANNSKVKSVDVITICDSTGGSIDVFSQSHLEDESLKISADDENEKNENSVESPRNLDQEKESQRTSNDQNEQSQGVRATTETIPEPFLSEVVSNISKDSPQVDLKNAAKTSTPDRPGFSETSLAPPPNYHNDDTLKMSSQSPSEDSFKSPDENVGHVILALKPSEFRKLHSVMHVDHHFYISQDMPDLGEKFLKMRSFLTNKKVDFFKRLSDVSSLSGTSSGYRGDSSSVVTSSDGSKRDRLSIMPEAVIAAHKVLSPLPKRLWSQPKTSAKEDDSRASSTLKVGTKVFAKWVERLDTKFWPGIIAEEKDEKWLIHFDDGLKKELKQDDIFCADSLTPGQQVNVEKDGGIFHVGILLSYSDCSQDDIFYTVELESLPNLPQGEAESISYRKFHLTLDQKNKLNCESATTSNSADVSLDNLVTGKRRSKPITPVKSTPKQGKKGGSAVETSVNEDEEGERKQLKKTRKTRPRLAKVSEAAEISTTDDEERGKTRSAKKGVSSANIFKDMVFILTQGKGKPSEDDLSYGASAMETETEEDDEKENIDSLKFDKRVLIRMIKDNGGKVLEKFPGEKEKIPANVLVISDRYCRTMTYLLGIAYGYDRVNFVWIHNCVTAKTLLPKQNYLLQIGFSAAKNREMEHHEAPGNLRGLFKDHHILIASSQKSFGDDWKPLLTRLGATVSVRTKGKLDRSLKKVDVIIGDSNPPSSIVKDARDKSMFVVSTEWIVQCLIDGHRVPYGDFVL